MGLVRITPAISTGGVSCPVDRAIVLQVLRDDHPERWPRAGLEVEVSELDAVSDALARLEAEGVVVLYGESVSTSRCARRLDAPGPPQVMLNFLLAAEERLPEAVSARTKNSYLAALRCLYVVGDSHLA
jgi:hypothetical protein